MHDLEKGLRHSHLFMSVWVSLSRWTAFGQVKASSWKIHGPLKETAILRHDTATLDIFCHAWFSRELNLWALFPGVSLGPCWCWVVRDGSGPGSVDHNFGSLTQESHVRQTVQRLGKNMGLQGFVLDGPLDPRTLRLGSCIDSDFFLEVTPS